MSLLELQYFSRQGGDPPTPIRQVRNASTYSVATSDKIIFVDTSISAVSLYLPSPKAVQSGTEIRIKDSSGHALTNNITLICRSDARHPNHFGAGETLDGQSSVTLDFGYAGVSVMSDGVNWLLSP